MLLLNVLYKMKGFEQGGSVSGRKQSGGLFSRRGQAACGATGALHRKIPFSVPNVKE